MSDRIQIFNTKGEQVAESELADELRTIMIVEAEGTPRFVSTVGSSDVIVAALVRDEDGWTIASADAAKPVRSGAKSTPDMHLSPGLTCRIGDLTFRLDRPVAGTGGMLLWRYDGSSISADQVLGGENVVALNRETNLAEINPSIADNELFSFFPTSEGIEVSTRGDGADRLSVAPRTLFSVGGFEGMFLTAEEAAQALRTSHPFVWPSRAIRARLKIAFLAIGAIFGIAAAFLMRARMYERLDAEPHGAVAIDVKGGLLPPNYSEEPMIFNITFFKMLPFVLSAEPNTVTEDLIQRGSKLSADPRIERKVAFLKDVTTIQRSILTERWEELRNVLAAVDGKTFVEFDAAAFYEDAKELSEFVSEKLPERLVESSAPGKSAEFSKLRTDIEACFVNLSSNIFVTGPVMERERDNARTLISEVAAYVRARDAVSGKLADGSKLVATDFRALYDAYAVIVANLQTGDAIYGPILDREKKEVRRIIEQGVSYVFSRKADEDSGMSATLLEPLSILAETAEIPAQKVAEWRKLAREAVKKVDSFYRALYARYRSELLSDPARAAATLEEILAVGDTGNGFHKWALREKKRIADGGKPEKMEVEK